MTRGYPRVTHISFGGPTLTIVVKGKLELFEMHRYCGPMPVNKQGNGRDLAPRHPFWAAVTWWDRQGREFNEDGTCRWVAKSEDDLLAEEGLRRAHVAGKHWKLVPIDKP